MEFSQYPIQSRIKWPHPNRRAMRLALAFAVFAAISALYTSAAASDEIDATYQRDRAACLHTSSQDRTACLKEAAAARVEAKRGRLADNNSQAQYEKNALMRCNALPAEERDACRRRMHGEGSMGGSVEGGGIYRELSVPVLPHDATSPAGKMPAK